MDYAKIIEDSKLNAIQIELDTSYRKKVPIGSSKFGGKPDLPASFEWYYYEGESPFTEQKNNRPLSFLAQINCEEAGKYDVENRLPKSGILYFFYELETMTAGFDPKDAGSAKVYYFNGSLDELKKTEFPLDLADDYKLPEIKLKFSSQYNAPAYEEISEKYEDADWDEYDNCVAELGYSTDGENCAKLLGYADIIQGEMLLECELVTNGLYCGDETGYKSPKRKQLEENRDKWKLLFQLDTVEEDDFELMFGDCGAIFYYIKEEDLVNLNFDNVWLISQCY